MTDIATVNYQPLDNMKGVWLRTIKTSFRGYGWLVAGLAFAVGLGIMILGLLQVGLFIMIGYGVFIGWQVQKSQDQIWREFGVANSWPVDVGVPDLILISPSLNYGHSQKLSPVIQANLNNLTVYLFSYKCTTGNGKSSQDHYFTVAMAALPKSLPHMLLLSKKSRVDLRENLDKHEKLQLEGDFNDYFELQVQKGQEIDVLSIITPDVMQTLVDNNQSEDIEIFNANLYFILRNDKRDAASVKALIASENQLSNQIIGNINHQIPAAAPAQATSPPPTLAPNTGLTQ